MPPITSIIWDLDGTLVDSFMLGYTASNEVLISNGWPRIEEEVYHECTIYGELRMNGASYRRDELP